MGFEPTDTDFAGRRVSHFATGAFFSCWACKTRTNVMDSHADFQAARTRRTCHIHNYYGIFRLVLSSGWVPYATVWIGQLSHFPAWALIPNATTFGRSDIPDVASFRKDMNPWFGPKSLPYPDPMKLLAVSCLLLVAGCGHPVQRFVPVSPEHPELALDTKTGQTCLAMGQSQTLPKCGDLYKSGE